MNTASPLTPALKKARNSNIELLRIIAMLVIVGCHFATHGGFDFNSQSVTLPRLWWIVLEMGGNFGVDVFVLISGYFLIENKKLSVAPKKVLRLWGEIFFYSVALFAVAVITKSESFSLTGAAKAFFPITFSQWWFASTYFVMFLIHPFINRLLHSFTKREYQVFLLVVTLLWCIIPTFTTSAYQSNPLIEFVLYYSVAGYIKLFGFRSNVKSAGWFGLWFVFCALKYLSCVCLITLGTKISIFSDNSLHFYNRNSILTLFGAVCLFMAFATMKPRSNRFVNTVASATFGVYLLHDSEFFRNFFWNDIFRNSSYQSTPLIIPYSIAVTIAVFIGCALIDLARQYILEKPVFSLIGRRCERENKASSGITDKFRKILFGKDEIID